MTEITEILRRIQSGEIDAAEALMREVYGELRQLAAAEAMRRILVDRARRRQRRRHGGDMEKVDQELDLIESAVPDDRIIAIHDALEALEAIDPLKAKLVKLKHFVGLENKEAAEALDISLSSVERYWAYSKAWLMKEIRQKTEKPRSFKIG